MKRIILVALCLSVVSCVTTPEEKSCINKMLEGTGYQSCKEYGYKETLKGYGITDGANCFDYALQEEKKYEGTHARYARTLLKLKLNTALKECEAKAKEKKKDCQAKVDACLLETPPSISQ